MSQLAYLCSDAASAERVGVADPATGLTVALFADDAAALAIMAEDAASAGLSVRDGRSLADLITDGAGVLADVVLVECPRIDAGGMAALMRLDERAARAGALLVVATSIDSLDDVFACLDMSAPRILISPTRAERLVALGAALARVPGQRLREMSEEDRIALLRLSEEVSRLAAKLDGLGSGAVAAIPLAVEDGSVGYVAQPTQGFRHAEREADLLRKPKAPLPDPRLVKTIIRHRALRADFFDGDLFADPAWDILLDLTAARAEHRRVSVTSLCIAARVPPTTALRWISQMVEAGILERVQDESDRRRAFVTLSDKAAEAMARYFDAIGTRVTAV